MATEDTTRNLAAITDQGAFERLATAVLREANPLYRLLTHQGVNAVGKTVKSPVDGILFIAGASPPHMVAVHHTTAEQADLEGKWLHDPSTVKMRDGKKPTQPAGDVLKTLEVFREAQADIPDLRGTLVLTTNKEPSDELVKDVTAAANAGGMAVEIWSRSNLSHFLDVDSNGQWLRRKFLGIEQERLSRDLLVELSKGSIGFWLPGDHDAWIDRELDKTLADHAAQSVVFVVGDSGVGKSVACFKRLARHIAKGGFGLILPHDTITNALSLDHAIDNALRQLHPTLAPNSGSDARALASEHSPLFLIVEDINKSGHAVIILEKLAAWSVAQGKDVSTGSTHILAPVWPRITSLLNEEARKRIASLAIETNRFSPQEGANAVEQKRCQAGTAVTRLEAEAISSALGQDPLLIALHDPAASQTAEQVIGNYIESSLARLAATRGQFTTSEYVKALRELASAMLVHRKFDPDMEDVTNWLGQSTELIRHVVHFREVIWPSGSGSQERIAFRHDRVRDWLLADAASSAIASGSLSDELLSEPFYAELLASGLLRCGQFAASAFRVSILNPLVPFYVLHLTAPGTLNHQTAVQVIKGWLGVDKNLENTYAHLRWDALRILARTDSPAVIELVQKFKSPNSFWALQARFRNGDVGAGVIFCRQHEPGVRIIGRQELFDYAQRRYGKSLTDALSKTLMDRSVPDTARVGALRLAGHFASQELADAIHDSWQNDPNRETTNLDEYLWAAAQCCGNDPARLLGPVCDAWAALPDEKPDQSTPSPRNSLASDHVRWAFQEGLSSPAARYFIERAKSEDLKWPITYMLHNIDDPDALEFLATELANTDKRLEGTNHFSPFAHTATNAWTRRQEDRGRPMSPASKDRLLTIWVDKTQTRHMRRRAFQLWAATITDGDIDILRSKADDDELANSVLWQRLIREDREAIPAFVEKLREEKNTHWWSLTRYIWSDELMAALDFELSRHGKTAPREWHDDETDRAHYLREVITRLPAAEAEQRLIEHWEYLKYSSNIIHAALYVATPRLITLVAEAVKSCPDPQKLFRFIMMHFGFKTHGHPGIARRTQIEALAPYAKYLSEMAVFDVLDICNARGWFDLRRAHFDSLAKRERLGRTYIDDDLALAELDEMLAKGRARWSDLWLEGYLKAGATLDHVFSVLRAWLSRQTDIVAFQIARDIIVHGGRRSDLAVLDAYQGGPADAVEAGKKDAAFAVCRRSLH